MDVALLIIFYFCTISGLSGYLSCLGEEASYVFLSFYVTVLCFEQGRCTKPWTHYTILIRTQLFFFLSTLEKTRIFLVSKANHLYDAFNPISDFLFQVFPTPGIFLLSCLFPFLQKSIYGHLYLLVCTHLSNPASHSQTHNQVNDAALSSTLPYIPFTVIPYP